MTLLDVPKIEEPRPIWLKEHEKCDEVFTPQGVFYATNWLGRVRITVCPTCGYEDVKCLHINNTVNMKGIRLECHLCGG